MRVLITGATGLVGTHLTGLFNKNNISVNYLTTSKNKIEKLPNYKGFYWNPIEGELDEKSLEDVDAIIHLAGASVAKRWTDSYKKEIIGSRTTSADLLYNALKNSEYKIPKFISASGISVYPSSIQKLYTENEKAIDDSFLGKVVEVWEAGANQFENLGMKVAKVRTGMVLDSKEGALPKMKAPASLNAGAAFGSGKQWQSWIHIDDLVGIYYYIFENNLEGIYNAVAPNPVTNEELMDCIAKHLDKKIWLPNIPAVALKVAMGEMATVVLSSQLVSSDKIQKEGYIFQYKKISKALEDLL